MERTPPPLDPSLPPPAVGARQDDGASGGTKDDSGENRLPPPAFVPTDGRIRRLLRGVGGTPGQEDGLGLPRDVVWGPADRVPSRGGALHGGKGQGPGSGQGQGEAPGAESGSERGKESGGWSDLAEGTRLELARILEELAHELRGTPLRTSHDSPGPQAIRDRAVVRGVVDGLLRGRGPYTG
ncbi:MAG: hypothetical protein EA352_12475 [Gemmatimonadales bacterium]|nr:MAG: hypothetical protein EA352_12475 [Gemmatimonadales bacterium]